MDKQKQAQLRAKFSHATHGGALRTRAFLNLQAESLHDREWLEAHPVYDSARGAGWAVRRMVVKSACFGDNAAGENTKIAQSYLANSNRPGHSLNFFDAMVKLHDYERAQPLLGYVQDSEGFGSNYPAEEYRDVCARDGLVFTDDDVFCATNGIVAEAGEFDTRLIQAAATPPEKTDYAALLPLPDLLSSRILDPGAFMLLNREIKKIRQSLFENGTAAALDDHAGVMNPFYKPCYATFKRDLDKALEAMRSILPLRKEDGKEGFRFLPTIMLTEAIWHLEFHALRLSVAWMKDAAYKNPHLATKSRVTRSIDEATKRCAHILRQMQVDEGAIPHLLDFRFENACVKSPSRGRHDGRKDAAPLSCNMAAIDAVEEWFSLASKRRPLPPPPPPPPRPSPLPISNHLGVKI